jgi:acyl-homoserine lactone acylase PvdQ
MIRLSRSTPLLATLLLGACGDPASAPTDAATFDGATSDGVPADGPAPDAAAPSRVTVRRDVYGMAHVDAADYYGAGYGVAVAQVDDHGLELQMAWALLHPDVATVLTEEATGIALAGQVPATLQFDPRGFPLAPAVEEPRLPTLPEIATSLAYMNFYAIADEALPRLDPTLRAYLDGFVAGANARLASRRGEFEASTDPRIQYMVSRGLHTRVVDIKDVIRAAAAGPLPISVGLVKIWAQFVHLVPATTDPVTLPGPPPADPSSTPPTHPALAAFRIPVARPTSSNEFGFSGTATESGRPIVMVDPHLPTHDAWGNSALTAIVRTPDIVIDAAITPGQPVPLVGHAMHPRTGSGVAITGTANAYTPTTCWYAPAGPALDTYRTSATGAGGAAFTTREVGGLTVREAGIHGRLIGQKRVRLGDQVVELGFLYRAVKDHKYSVLESLWPAFHARDVAEFHAALDRHAQPVWNMTVGFSTPEVPSTVLYINNQIAARRNPNPDGDPATIADWNGFMDALNPLTEWEGTYHAASELPQIVAEPNGREFLHCHNCQPEMVTGVMPEFPYMIGGYAGYTNHRQLAGDRFYAEAVSGDQRLSLAEAEALANHVTDLQLEDVVAKLRPTLATHRELLPLDAQERADAEFNLWTSGPVEGTLDNTRIARVLAWVNRVSAVPGLEASKDLMRLARGSIYPAAEFTFDPTTPLAEADALLALTALAEVGATFAKQYGPESRTWGEIHRYRPTVFGRPFATGPADYAMLGAPNALASVGGPIIDSPAGKVHLVTGGQNYVQVIEVGRGSRLKRSVSGASDPSLPYVGALSPLYAAGVFTPTGADPAELTPGRFLSEEQFEVDLP